MGAQHVCSEFPGLSSASGIWNTCPADLPLVLEIGEHGQIAFGGKGRTSPSYEAAMSWPVLTLIFSLREVVGLG